MDFFSLNFFFFCQFVYETRTPRFWILTVSMILPGTSGGYMKEIFRIMDDEKRVKETEIIEGVYIDLGFDVYRVRLEIIEKDAESTIIRSTVMYEFDDTKTELASLVTVKPLQTMAEEIGKYVSEKKYNA